MEPKESNEAMEMQLWDFIDGNCTEADKARIAGLLATDHAWQDKYTRLLEFNAGIVAAIETEQPSMRFTKNVMETVAKSSLAPAARKYVNPLIIKGIAAFFVILIMSFICYAFAHTNWSDGSPGWLSKLNLKRYDLAVLYNSAYFNVFIMVNIVLALAVIDGLVRRNNKAPEQQN